MGEQERDLPNGHSNTVSSTTPTRADGNEKITSASAAKQANGSSQSAVYDAWKEAKAKSQARVGRRPNPAAKVTTKQVDVYDDIDGANAARSPSMSHPQPTSSTPQKNKLDPLRNQRPTPAATAPRSTATLGFFKQFHKSKADAVGEELKRTAEVGRMVNGQSVKEKEQDVRSTTTVNDKGANANDVSSVHSSTRAPKPSWTYAKVPNKTFEDEIRDLADAARERAERGEEDETAATLSRERRSKIRTWTPEKVVETPKREVKKTSTIKSKPTPKVQKRTPKKDASETAAVNSFDYGAVNDMDADSHDDDEVLDGSESPLRSQPPIAVTPLKSERVGKTQVTSRLESIAFELSDLATIQSILMDKLTGKRPVPLKNLEVEYSKVSSLVAQTVGAGESNSMLLIGARGTGKSALINQVLREQAKKHQDDFHVVRLNGFIHTDDKIALREIWRQLGREMEIEADESTPKNYADTLTTLLALLSHPAEQGREQQQDQITKSVVFVIDDFDLFANHPRQTLLYNLFDIAQSRKAPIAVLGLTARIDVAESLEKRVKSRFSHRYVHLAMSKSFTSFKEACQAAMTIERGDMTEAEREILGSTSDLIAKLGSTKGQSQPAVVKWNTLVEELTTQEPFLNHLRHLYNTTKSVPEFHTSMLFAASTMATGEPLKANRLLEHFIQGCTTVSLQPPDSKLNILSSLSTLQLALLICAARLTAIHSVDNVPFAQAYEEYKTLASKAKLQASASGALAQGAASRVSSKDVARDVWEELLATGLVMEDGNRGCRVDVGLEEIGMSGVDLGSWGRWCRQI